MDPRTSKLLIPLLFICAASTHAATEQEEFFESKIRPLFLSKCGKCHGPSAKGGLQLDNRDMALKGGNTGKVIIPGNAKDSILYQAITDTHDSLSMPPDESLEPHEIESVKQWINDGAVWPISKVEFFQRNIFYVLENRCGSCHNEKNKKGGLSIASRERILAGGESGPAIVPGDPGKSLLLKAISYEHDLKMPPDEKKKLNSGNIRAITQWIQDGAVWVAPNAVPEYVITDQQRQHWAFQPLVNPKANNSKDHPVDSFIDKRIADAGIQATPVADARTLIRRATYDLTGLPATPDAIDAFVTAYDKNGKRAYDTLIDSLLESDHYGERWGRHWLDLVRYADTAGDAADFPVPEAYKYRNYVIDSFNNDKPYDQFVREQIAGDLLPAKNDDQRWEQTIGTGYIAISRRIGVSPQNLTHITIEDTIGNLGKTFLGLTLGCARCHDHKFDPIPTTDYYALYGIFDSTLYPHAGAEHKPWRQDFVYRVGNEKADEILADKRAELEIWNKKERVKMEEYRDFQRKKITEPGKTREAAWAAVLAMREARRPIAESMPELERCYGVQDDVPHDVHVQRGGDPNQRSRGQLVRRGFLQILGGQKLTDDANGSGRLELSDWITSDDNPLFARVMANRIWHYHFGRGIVRTTSDFGVRGAAPTHPQLLDHLAWYFAQQNWSVKQMHRYIMTSTAYMRQSSNIPASSDIDPNNDMFWRFNRQRLDAEQIRDTLLTFSHEIDHSVGGRHPFDHRLTYFFRQHDPFVGNYQTNRRSIYMMQQRIVKNDYLDLFDGPDGNIQMSERKVTTTTLQALFMMNSPFIYERSKKIAGLLISEQNEPKDRAIAAYRMVFGRVPTEQEVAQSTLFSQDAVASLTDGGMNDVQADHAAWTSFIRGMISSNEFIYID